MTSVGKSTINCNLNDFLSTPSTKETKKNKANEVASKSFKASHQSPPLASRKLSQKNSSATLPTITESKEEVQNVRTPATSNTQAATPTILANAVIETHPDLTPVEIVENTLPPLAEFNFEIPQKPTASTFNRLIGLFREVISQFEVLKKGVDDLRVNCQDVEENCKNINLVPPKEFQGEKRIQYIQSQKARYEKNYEKYYSEYVENVNKFNKILPYIQKSIELFSKAKIQGDETLKIRVLNNESLIESANKFKNDMANFPADESYPYIVEEEIKKILRGLEVTISGIENSDNEYLESLNLEKQMLSGMEVNLSHMNRRLNKDIPKHLDAIAGQVEIKAKPRVKIDTEKGLVQSFLSYIPGL